MTVNLSDLVDQLMGVEDQAALLASIREKIPGLEETSDEEILKDWSALRASAESGDKKAVAAVEAILPEGRSWDILSAEGKPLTDADLSKMSAADLLKLQYGYKANGADQAGDLATVIRRAQQAHGVDGRMTTLEQERNSVAEQLTGANSELAELRDLRTQFVAALGDDAQLAALREAVGTAAAPTRDDPQPMSDAEVTLQSQHVWNQHVQPHINSIVQRFGADPSEVTAQVAQFIQREGTFWTEEKVEAYVAGELSDALTAAGYEAAAAAESTAPDRVVFGRTSFAPRVQEVSGEDRVTSLEAELAAAQEQLGIQRANESAPGGEDGNLTGGEGFDQEIDMSKIESVADMQAELEKLMTE